MGVDTSNTPLRIASITVISDLGPVTLSCSSKRSIHQHASRVGLRKAQKLDQSESLSTIDSEPRKKLIHRFRLKPTPRVLGRRTSSVREREDGIHNAEKMRLVSRRSARPLVPKTLLPDDPISITQFRGTNLESLREWRLLIHYIDCLTLQYNTPYLVNHLPYSTPREIYLIMLCVTLL
jgi:hypothetical protein